METAPLSGSQEKSEATRRLVRDFKKIQTDAEGFAASPVSDDDIFKWKALLFGPEGTIWEGGTFKLSLTFTSEYPRVAPTVIFLSEIFHPNVYKDGRICLDILDNNWSPVYDVSTILISLQSLLVDPNPKSPANLEAARMYENDKAAYNNRVNEVVEKTWDVVDSD